jgi:hypothetical protein
VILPTIALIVLGLIVLAFVLEPVLRARPDAVVLDAAALPNTPPEITDEGDQDPAAADDAETPESIRTPIRQPGIESRPTGDLT